MTAPAIPRELAAHLAQLFRDDKLASLPPPAKSLSDYSARTGRVTAWQPQFPGDEPPF